MGTCLWVYCGFYSCLLELSTLYICSSIFLVLPWEYFYRVLQGGLNK